jgi:ribonuclease HI
MLLAEYDIVFMTRKAAKGSVIADHLADHAMENYEPLNFDLPDEDVIVIENGGGESDTWTLYFDGAVNVSGNGAGAVVISPENKQYPVSTRLLFECTNNTAEYEACIIGLEVALELKAKKLEVFGDSLLIICQVKGEWQTKDEKLKLYQNYLLRSANEFEEIKFTHISRDKNQFVDALATLASMTQVDIRSKIQPIDIEVRSFQAHCCLIEESPDGKPWYNDIEVSPTSRIPSRDFQDRLKDFEENDHEFLLRWRNFI